MSDLGYYYNKGEQDGSEGYGNYDRPCGFLDEDEVEAYDKGYYYAMGQYDYNHNCKYNCTGDDICKEAYSEGWNNAEEQ